MSEFKPRFAFPTSTADAVALYRLQADVRDHADGVDDVDESANITEQFAENLWRRAQTAGVKELSDAAAGQRSTTQAEVSASSAVYLSAVDPDRAVGWQDVRDALDKADDGGKLDEARLQGAFVSLGFVRDVAHESRAGCMIFSRGRERIGVRLYLLGPIPVAELAVDKKNEDESRSAAAERLSPGSAATYVAGTLVPPKYWRKVVGEFTEVLEYARDAFRRLGTQLPALPLDYEALRRFLSTGKPEDKIIEDAREAAEIATAQAPITDLWSEMIRAGTAPRGLLVQYDGTDGAGKSSTSRIVNAALRAANDELLEGQRYSFSTEVFKAPTDDDQRRVLAGEGEASGLPRWLWRFYFRGLPGERQVMTHDRYQPGDWVYGRDGDPAALEQMAAESVAFERLAQGRGIMLFKLVMYAREKKQSKTFGKRMGRAAFVDALILESTQRGLLNEESRGALEAIKAKIEDKDFQALEQYRTILPRFKEFAQAAGSEVPFFVIDASSRHEARLAILARLHSTLRQYHDRKMQEPS